MYHTVILGKYNLTIKEWLCLLKYRSYFESDEILKNDLYFIKILNINRVYYLINYEGKVPKYSVFLLSYSLILNSST